MIRREERACQCAVCKQPFVMEAICNPEVPGLPDVIHSRGESGWFAFSGAEGLMPTVHVFCSAACSEKLLAKMAGHRPS